jgi:uncharacterized iron-regulated membrane protein
VKKSLLRSKRKNESWFKYLMGVSHLWLGLLSSIVVIVVCLSGCLYAFRQQINDYADKDCVKTTTHGNAFFPIDSLVSIFEKQYGKHNRIFIPEWNDDRSIQISSGDRDGGITACYHPETGEFLGIKKNSAEGFFRFILDLHRNLAMGETGKFISGVATLIFVFMLISGFVLWFPSKVKQLKNSFAIKWKARFYRLNYDLHNVLGFYSMLVLVLIALTGLYVSFTWVKNGIIVGLGGESIVVTEDNTALKEKLANAFSDLMNAVTKESDADSTATLRYEDLLAHTNALYPNDGTISISKSNDELQITTIVKNDRNNWLNFYVPNKIEFGKTGEVIRTARYADLRLNEQFVAVAKPLHTGEIMGLWSTILYFIVSLIAASLPITGFIIWWKKGGKPKAKART